MRRCRLPPIRVLAVLAIVAAGCGQKGPLFLPGETPAAVPTEPETAAAEEGEQEADGERP